MAATRAARNGKSWRLDVNRTEAKEPEADEKAEVRSEWGADRKEELAVCRPQSACMATHVYEQAYQAALGRHV